MSNVIYTPTSYTQTVYLSYLYANADIDVSNGATVSLGDYYDQIDLAVGHDYGFPAAFTVSGGGTALIATNVTVGYGAQGELILEDGASGTIQADDASIVSALVIGAGSDGTGTVLVTGAGSALTVGPGGADIGSADDGLLSIQQGATVIGTDVNAGFSAGENGWSGTIAVDGAGSALQLSDFLLVGAGGDGLLLLGNDGSVNASTGAGIGVEDVGSAVVTTGALFSVGSGGLALGLPQSGEGFATVGAGGAIRDLGPLNIGGGALDITSGGTAIAANLAIAHGSGSTGAVTLEAGGTLAVPGTIYIGDGGSGVFAWNGGILTTGELIVEQGGTLDGYGTLPVPVLNVGTIVVPQGELALTGGLFNAQGFPNGSVTIAAQGTLSIASSLTLDALTVAGTLLTSGSLVVTGNAPGGGEIVIEGGSINTQTGHLASGIVEVDGSLGASVDFSAPEELLRVGTVGQTNSIQGQIQGFQPGDAIDLVGVKANNASYANGVLTFSYQGVVTDTLQLVGNYSGSLFTVTPDGTGSDGNGGVIVKDAGSGHVGVDVTISDQIGGNGALDAAVLGAAVEAASAWTNYLVGQNNLSIQVVIAPIANAGILGLTTSSARIDPFVTSMDGKALGETFAQYDLLNPVRQTSSPFDMSVTINAKDLNIFYFGSGINGGATSLDSSSYDLLTTLEHEIGHGLGFSDVTNGENLYQHFTSSTFVSPIVDADFIGPDAEAVAGGSVPLTSALAEGLTQYVHVDISTDLMYPRQTPGLATTVGSIDLAILKDTGVPITTTQVACFCSGSLILTADGDIEIEKLRVGSKVWTKFNKMLPVVWVGGRMIDCARHPEPEKVWPFRVTANAFGPGRPMTDLWLSPDHAIFLERILVPVKLLQNGHSISQVPVDHVTYYHVRLPVHDVVLANGLETESYLGSGGRDMPDDVLLTSETVPEADRWEYRACAPLVITGSRLRDARAAQSRWECGVLEEMSF